MRDVTDSRDGRVQAEDNEVPNPEWRKSWPLTHWLLYTTEGLVAIIIVLLLLPYHLADSIVTGVFMTAALIGIVRKFFS